MTDINKQFGFYGAVKNWFDEKDTDLIWETLLKRLNGLYTNKTEDQNIELLNSRAGRHLADSLLDQPDKKTLGAVMIKIAMLNKLKLADYWACLNGIVPHLATINENLLYKNALQVEIKKKDVREFMAQVLDCKNDQVWTDPKIWLDSEYTTTRELKIMWGYVQEKINKRNQNGNNSTAGKETKTC